MAILEITTCIGCRVACRFCPQDKLVERYAGSTMMSVETIEKCLDTVPPEVNVMFSGYSEPFQNPDCATMIETTSDRGHVLSLFTTCVGMTLPDVDRISKRHFKVIVIHAADAWNNAKIRVTEDYVTVVDAMLRSFPSAEVMTMGALHPRLRHLKSRLRPAPMHSRAGNLAGSRREPMVGPIRCGVCEEQTHNVLLPDGSLYLCCMDFGLQHRLGNLTEQSYRSVLAGAEYRAIKEAMGTGGDCLCRTCEQAVPA